MYEATLLETFRRIFDFKRATYDLPSESQEQETLFVEIKTSDNRCTDGRFLARVTGQIVVFCNVEKLPYGYFGKKIAEASASDTANLFFFDMEQNAGTFASISQRSLSFIYLFDSQHNPISETITGIEVTTEGQ